MTNTNDPDANPNATLLHDDCTSPLCKQTGICVTRSLTCRSFFLKKSLEADEKVSAARGPTPIGPQYPFKWGMIPPGSPFNQPPFPTHYDSRFNPLPMPPTPLPFPPPPGFQPPHYGHGLNPQPHSFAAVPPSPFHTTDLPLPEDHQITLAWNQDLDDTQGLHREAIRLVTAQRTHLAQVALVHWLLVRLKNAEARIAELSPKPPVPTEADLTAIIEAFRCDMQKGQLDFAEKDLRAALDMLSVMKSAASPSI
jgi:hypothetical protein